MTTFSFMIICVQLWSGVQSENPLSIVHNWSQLEFVFPNDEAKKLAIEKEYYIPDDPSHNVPIDVDVYYGRDGTRRIFITIPRFSKGRPITLGTVDEDNRIHGYPDYSWNDRQGNNCDHGLTSVFRTMIDKCDRLWVLDAGRIGEKYHCHPQLLAFNLNDDSLVYRHRLQDYPQHSLYITPMVDTRTDDCSGTFVYLADVTAFGLSVVDVDNNRSWRIEHRLFYPYPSVGTFIINGLKFDLMDGLLGLGLSPLQDDDRTLYFHALASVNENAVLTSSIRNSHFAEHTDPDSIWKLPGQRQNQSAAEAMDRNGILYFGIMNPPSIWCWNSNTEFSQNNFHQIAYDEDTLQFASGVKVITNRDGQDEIWVLISNIQRLYTGTMHTDRVNFRIHTGSLTDILKSSPCNSPIDNETSERRWKSSVFPPPKNWKHPGLGGKTGVFPDIWEKHRETLRTKRNIFSSGFPLPEDRKRLRPGGNKGVFLNIWEREKE